MGILVPEERTSEPEQHKGILPSRESRRQRRPSGVVEECSLVVRRLSAAIPPLLALPRCAKKPLCCETARDRASEQLLKTYLVCSLAERKEKRVEKKE